MSDVRLSYAELNGMCERLSRLRGEYDTLTGEVNTITSQFSDMWEGKVKDNFEEDYLKLAKSYQETADVMEEVTTEIINYIRNMQDIDDAYGKEHVTIG